MLALGPLRADQSSPVTENAGDDARAITYGARGSKAGRRGHSRPPTTGAGLATRRHTSSDLAWQNSGSETRRHRRLRMRDRARSARPPCK